MADEDSVPAVVVLASDVESGHSQEKDDTTVQRNNMTIRTAISRDDQSSASIDDEEISRQIATERKIRRRRIFLFLLLLAVVVFVIIDFVTTKYISSGFNSLYHWVDVHPLPGAFALTFVVFLSTLAFIPGALLTVGCGFAYGMILGLGEGVAVGSIVVFTGAALGSELSFIIGRYLMRDCVGGWMERYPLFRAVDVAMKEKGLRIFLLLRLSPVIPYNALNYMAGATAVTLFDYSCALIGLLPGTVLYVFVGASAGSSMEHDEGNGKDYIRIASIVVGVIVGVLGVALVSYYAKKELNKIIAEEGAEKRQQYSDSIVASGDEDE